MESWKQRKEKKKLMKEKKKFKIKENIFFNGDWILSFGDTHYGCKMHFFLRARLKYGT